MLMPSNSKYKHNQRMLRELLQALIRRKSFETTPTKTGSYHCRSLWQAAKNPKIASLKPSTLRFLINILDQISVLVGNFVKINKHTGPNKHTGAKLLAQNTISYAYSTAG